MKTGTYHIVVILVAVSALAGIAARFMPAGTGWLLAAAPLAFIMWAAASRRASRNRIPQRPATDARSGA